MKDLAVLLERASRRAESALAVARRSRQLAAQSRAVIRRTQVRRAENDARHGSVFSSSGNVRGSRRLPRRLASPLPAR